LFQNDSGKQRESNYRFVGFVNRELELKVNGGILYRSCSGEVAMPIPCLRQS